MQATRSNIQPVAPKREIKTCITVVFCQRIIKNIFIFYFVFINCFSFSQQNNIDSLLSLLKKDKEDTNKVNALNGLAKEMELSGDYEKGIQYAADAKQLAEKINYNKGITVAYGNLGNLYYRQGDYPKSLENHFAALKIDEAVNNKSGIAKQLGNIGLVYSNQSDYVKALDYYFKALKMAEELGNKNNMAALLGNIGIVYREQGDYPKASDYYFRALKMAEKLGNKNLIAIWLGNIGIVYYDQKDYTNALDYDFRALKMREELGAKNLTATCLGNIGIVYRDKAPLQLSPEGREQMLDTALQYYFKALKMAEEIGDKNGIARHMGNIGYLYAYTKKYPEAEKYLSDALKMNKETGAQDNERHFEEWLSELYSKTNRYQLAMEHYKKAMAIKDTIFSKEEKKQLVQKEMNYEFEKKEATAKAEQEKKDIVAADEKRKQQIIIYSVSGGLFLMFLLAGVIFKSLQINKRKNKIITAQKEEVEKQREEIAHKNKDLTDSILYAERIQRAILTSEQYLNDMFLPQGQTASHFILYKPKDIVAGDFYWAYKTQKGKAIWLSADCTGHGVPGAFMSMIGNSLLNEIVIEKGIDEPAEILNRLRAGIIKAVGQSGEEAQIKDGMDCALCCWDKANNKIIFSGANNSLWIIRNGECIVIEPDGQPIGSYLVMNPFTNREFQLRQGDTLYTFTDGYCDQFGGVKGKKFKTKPFRELLLSIQDKSMSEQREILNNTIEKWKGEIEQIDDISVFGVRI